MAKRRAGSDDSGNSGVTSCEPKVARTSAVTSIADQTFTASFEPLNYQSLPVEERQVRLLRMVLNGNRDQNLLRFGVGVGSLEHSEDFNAVSYTWGNPARIQRLLIGNHTFMVTKNCHEALSQIYEQWEQRRLKSPCVWVDSICINQDDNAEKSLQVAMMGEIYSQAFQVLACVGLHENGSDFLFVEARDTASFGFSCDHADFLCTECRLPWQSWALSLGREKSTLR